MWRVTVDQHVGLVEIDVHGHRGLFSRKYIDDEQAAGIEWWLGRAPAGVPWRYGEPSELAGAIFKAITSGHYEDGKAVLEKSLPHTDAKKSKGSADGGSSPAAVPHRPGSSLCGPGGSRLPGVRSSSTTRGPEGSYVDRAVLASSQARRGRHGSRAATSSRGGQYGT